MFLGVKAGWNVQCLSPLMERWFLLELGSKEDEQNQTSIVWVTSAHLWPEQICYVPSCAVNMFEWMKSVKINEINSKSIEISQNSKNRSKSTTSSTPQKVPTHIRAFSPCAPARGRPSSGWTRRTCPRTARAATERAQATSPRPPGPPPQSLPKRRGLMFMNLASI